MKISCIIIAKNEAHQIKRCLDSVSWTDEVIVVDSMSEDNTADLAEAMGAQVHEKKFVDYADQKNFALSKAKGDWVLSLDADEVITPELQSEIQSCLLQNTQLAAYRIRRQSKIFGRFFKFTGTQEDKPIRLFKRETSRFSQPIHESLIVQGNIGVLKECILHYTYSSIKDYMDRLNRYTSMEAKLLFSKHQKVSGADLWLRPAARFMQLYFWKVGLLDGWQGFVFSFLSAYYVLVKYLKLSRLNQAS